MKQDRLFNIALVAYLIGSVLFFGSIGFLIYRAVDEIGERGLRPIVEEIWEGPQ